MGACLSDVRQMIVKPEFLNIMDFLTDLHSVLSWQLLFFVDNDSGRFLPVSASHNLQLLRITAQMEIFKFPIDAVEQGRNIKVPGKS